MKTILREDHLTVLQPRLSYNYFNNSTKILVLILVNILVRIFIFV